MSQVRPVTDARTVALRVLRRVEEGSAYADRALDAEATRAGLDPRERALAAHLALGTITWQRLLDHVVAGVARRDPARLDPVSRAVVRLGAFQLLRSDRIPAHAAVATSVALVRSAGNPAAAGLVNAVLRRVADGGEALVAALPDATARDAAVRRSYPDWIAELWWAAYGAADTRALLDAGNEPPEIAWRVNTLRAGARVRAEAALGAAGVAFHGDPQAPDAIVLDGPFDVAGSGLLDAGDVVPMSRASQRIAPLLAVEPGMRVLDACAAPGGKAGQIAAALGGGRGLVCVERDPRRADGLRRALARQGAGDAEIVVADATAPPALGAFDAILLDAPCTGLGVIASRADLRWRREQGDVAALAALQLAMIDALEPLLAPGGRLVYAVCTLTPEENRGALGAREPRSELVTWPPRDGDGFYAAVLAA
jgi:16S rRNA (cytosine967-C5)-methyltransferase